MSSLYIVHAAMNDAALRQQRRSRWRGAQDNLQSSEWKHLVTFRTLTGGAPLCGFYSFIEDFRRDGASLHPAPRARFGNRRAKGSDGKWVQLTEARFTADATQVDNFDAGVQNGDFYLATGGDTEKHTKLQTILRRPLSSNSPPCR